MTPTLFSSMWIILSVVAFIVLIVFFMRGPNAVWGGATIGLFIGIIMVVFNKVFSWSIIYKPIVVGILVGLAAELLSLFSKALKNKNF